MTVAIGLIALGLLILLAGGPAEFMLTCDRTVRGIAEVIRDFLLTAR